MLFPPVVPFRGFRHRTSEAGLTEVVPQGTLAERIRAAGAGIGGFYTRTTIGTSLADGKERRIHDGKEHALEDPHADVALVKADLADRWGNLTYRLAAEFWPDYVHGSEDYHCTGAADRGTGEISRTGCHARFTSTGSSRSQSGSERNDRKRHYPARRRMTDKLSCRQVAWRLLKILRTATM